MPLLYTFEFEKEKQYMHLNSSGGSGSRQTSNSWSAKSLRIEVPRFNCTLILRIGCSKSNNYSIIIKSTKRKD